MRWPLKIQILIPLVSLILLTVLLVSSISAYLADRREKQRAQSQLQNIMSTLEMARFPLTGNVLAQMKGFSGADFIVQNEAENILTATCDIEDGSILRAQLGGLNPGPISLKNQIEIGDVEYFHAMLLTRAEKVGDRRKVHVLFPEQAYKNAWRQSVLPPLFVGAATFILSVLAAIFLATRFTRPILRLRSQVDRIAEGEFQAISLPGSDDEIRDLSHAINRMAKMLSQYEGQVRRNEQLRTLGQLGGGIAHQLRNSATGCRLAMEIHLRGCHSPDRESLEVALRQLELIEEYVKRFLSLGQTQERKTELVELNALVRETLPLIEPSAAHASVKIDCEFSERPAHVRGDASSLAQMLINLLLNAIEATSHAKTVRGSIAHDENADVRIRVSDQCDQQQVLLEVLDCGDGPAASVQEHLFEPLVSEKPDGVGLGLSVVKNIAEQHEGQVSWRRDDGWTCFCVQLPATLDLTDNRELLHGQSQPDVAEPSAG